MGSISVNHRAGLVHIIVAVTSDVTPLVDDVDMVARIRKLPRVNSTRESSADN